MRSNIKHGCGCGGGSTYGAQGNPTTDEGYTWNGPDAPAPKPDEVKKPAK